MNGEFGIRNSEFGFPRLPPAGMNVLARRAGWADPASGIEVRVGGSICVYLRDLRFPCGLAGGIPNSEFRIPN